jgi:uncharacterized membrane protein
MTWLIALGVVLFAFIHFLPVMAAGLRRGIIDKVGAGPYKGVFALAVAGSVALMVFGWRSTEPVDIYLPPDWGRGAAWVLMLIAFILFAAAQRPSIIKRFLRHPQLTGLIAWSVGHLLANGDSRSVVLFGGLGIWAVITIIALNIRDGAYEPPVPQSLGREAIGLVISVAVFAVVVFLHPYFTGVTPSF